MVNLLNSVCALIAEKLPSLPPLYIDEFLDAKGDALIARHDPSQAKITEFNDGSSTGEIAASFYARSAKADKARRMLWDIQRAIDRSVIRSAIGEEGAETTAEVSAVTNPQFVGTDDKRQSIYTCAFRITFNSEPIGDL